MSKTPLKNPIFEKRLMKLLVTLGNNEAFLTVSAADVYYLTGCTGSNNHLLICSDKTILFTDGRYLTQISEQMQINLHVEEISPNYTFEQALRKILAEYSVSTLKFSPEHMSYLTGKSMVSALPEGAQPVQEGILALHRAEKDEMEIQIIAQNTHITKAAYLYIQGVVQPGMTECEVAAELEYYCRKQGAEKMSFDSIIASGVRSALPHGVASQKVINDGELIQFDFGIIKDKYCSDFSRVFALGHVDPNLLQARHVVEDALKEALKHARCGMTGQEIDAISRNYLNEKGYGQYFVHGLGHSLGLEVHENPRLNAIWDKPITENMVLTLEPGVYFPGLGGVRLEDVVVMRSDKFELITDCSYDA